MALRSKVGLILLGVFLLFGIIDFITQRFIIYPGFQSLEYEEAIKNSKRAVQSIESEIHHLNSFCHDWSSWDDTYEFVLSQSEEYKEANLTLPVFKINSLNLIYFCDNNGKVIWGEIRDLKTEEIIQLSGFPKEAFPKSHPLISVPTTNKPLSDLSVNGIFLTGMGPMLVASRPILNSNNEGPSRGSVIMGRFLNESVVKTLVKQTEVDFQVYSIRPGMLPVNIKEKLNRITDKSKYVVEIDGKDNIDAYTSIADINGKPAILIKSNLQRKITAKGDVTMRYAMYSVLTSGLGVLIVMLLLLQRIVLTPITKLTNHTLLVAKTGNLSERLSMNRQDEIGTLAGEFDMMLQQLSDTRNKLLEQSYYSGLAEITSETLHNARNTLTPMVGQISMAQAQINNTPLENIERALSELESEKTDPEREQLLFQFLLLGSRQMLTSLQDVRNQLSNTLGYASQVETVLAVQDKFSHAERAIESLQLIEILDKAYTFVPHELLDMVSMDIDPEISELPPIRAERVVLTQVVVCMLKNAAESIMRAGKTSGQIEIKGEAEWWDDVETAHIRIIDNGAGLDPGILKDIFTREFSDKRSKGSGFGLHWCGNVISAMNGRIYAESEGPDQGACFHIVLPLHL